MRRLVAVAVQANLILQCASETNRFCGGAQSWTCFLCEEPEVWGGGGQQEGIESFSPCAAGLFPPGKDCFLLVSHEHSCSVALSVRQLLGTRACADRARWLF